MICKGVFVALWTPTDTRGCLLHDAFSQIMRFLVAQSVHGFVVGGSTGEFLRLSLDVRKEALEAAIKNAGGLPVYTNVSSSIPEETKELIQHAKKVNAHAIMALPPLYYPLFQEDIIEYYLDLAHEAQGLPLILYNYPECARNELEKDTVRYLVERKVAAGIKQSGANLAFIKDLVDIGKDKNFIVYAGADTKLPEAMRMGASGCIGGLGNAIADISVEVFLKMQRGEDISELEIKLQTIGSLVKEESFPYTSQLLMEARGLPVGSLKLPRSQSSLERHKKLVAEARSLFQLWGLVR